MGERLRRMLDEELAEQQPPPVGALVGQAIAHGRRIRRIRRFRGAAIGLVAYAVLLGGVALVQPWRPAGSQRFAGPPAGSQPFAGPPAATVDLPQPALTPATGTAVRSTDASPSAQASPATDVPRPMVTPAALLVLLLDQLPQGRTADFAGYSDPIQTVAQLSLDRGRGPGLIRVDVPPVYSVQPPYCDPDDQGYPATICTVDDNGSSITVFELPDDCTQSLSVVVHRLDGTVVSLTVASCGIVDGRPGPPTAQALSVTEAVRIASDPRWGPTIEPRYATLGAERFPKLPPLLP